MRTPSGFVAIVIRTHQVDVGWVEVDVEWIEGPCKHDEGRFRTAHLSHA